MSQNYTKIGFGSVSETVDEKLPVYADLSKLVTVDIKAIDPFVVVNKKTDAYYIGTHMEYISDIRYDLTWLDHNYFKFLNQSNGLYLEFNDQEHNVKPIYIKEAEVDSYTAAAMNNPSFDKQLVMNRESLDNRLSDKFDQLFTQDMTMWSNSQFTYVTGKSNFPFTWNNSDTNISWYGYKHVFNHFTNKLHIFLNLETQVIIDGSVDKRNFFTITLDQLKMVTGNNSLTTIPVPFWRVLVNSLNGVANDQPYQFNFWTVLSGEKVTSAQFYFSGGGTTTIPSGKVIRLEVELDLGGEY